MIKKLYYISEIFLPSTSAYSIHVMKICNEFSNFFKKTSLLVFRKARNKNFHKLYKCKNNFNIVDFHISKNNFFTRILYALKIIIFLKKKDSIIISRSIISALLLSLVKKKVILEIHHTLEGFTKFLFYFVKKFQNFQNIKFIFISKKLKKDFNLKNKSIILDDAVDINDFNIKKKEKIYKNTCAYAGSFAKGKGIENILKIASYCKHIKFHLYGDFSNSIYSKNYFKNFKNVNYKGYIKYKDIPITLSRYHILLLPYSKKVYVRSNNLETSQHMSPLKLFDYLSSGKVIIASKMPVYDHILNKKNSILLNYNQHKKWALKIDYVFKNLKIFNKLKLNALNTAKKNTWHQRVKKIIEFIND